MNETLISLETAKLLKEKEFGLKTKRYYNTNKNDFAIFYNRVKSNWKPDGLYATPTQSLLQKWLREEKNIHISIILRTGTGKYRCRLDYEGPTWWKNKVCGMFSSYEEALEAGLQEGLNLIP